MTLPRRYLGGIALYTLGLILHIVAMATASWAVAGSSENGIFIACLLGICSHLTDDGIRGDQRTVRTLTVMAVIAGCIAVLLSTAYAVLDKLDKSPNTKYYIKPSAAASVCAFLLILVAIIIYGVNVYEPISDVFDLGYSFFLSLVGGFILAAGGACVLSAEKNM